MSGAVDPRDRLLTARQAARRLGGWKVESFKRAARTSPALLHGRRFRGRRVFFLASAVVRFAKFEMSAMPEREQAGVALALPRARSAS